MHVILFAFSSSGVETPRADTIPFLIFNLLAISMFQFVCRRLHETCVRHSVARSWPRETVIYRWDVGMSGATGTTFQPNSSVSLKLNAKSYSLLILSDWRKVLFFFPSTVFSRAWPDWFSGILIIS